MNFHSFLRRALLCCALFHAAGAQADSTSVYLEDLTTVEVAAAIRSGSTTIIIPVGGTEQNGPHMALGKHNARARILSGRIAQSLGKTLVAPVLAYVPEGNISPPTEHMRFAGTISVPEVAFRSVIEAAARGFRQHGFRDIVLVGDSGNYQAALKAVAARLNQEWRHSGARVHYVAEYYRAAQTTYLAALRARGVTPDQIGTHAATADTALMLALDPSLVRGNLLGEAARHGKSAGTGGDPQAATAELGQLGVEAIITQTTLAIRSALSAAR
ncbi:MAG: creatininase family protein [Burkholderiaceae bacterium]